MPICRYILAAVLAFSLIPGWLGCQSRRPLFDAASGDIPSILYVQSGRIVTSRYLATSSFRVGDRANFKITAVDEDLDVHALYIEAFFPKDALEPTISSGPIDLKPQPERRYSFFLDEPFDVPGPPGEWRVELQLEDGKGYRSKPYRLFAIVH